MRYLTFLLLLCLSVWGLALPSGALEQGFMFWRNQGINLSGLIAVALMGALILMATRPHWLEQRLGGLDHMYQLHKWSGITAGSMVIVHWLLTKSPRWLVDWGLLQLGPKPAGAHIPDAWRGIAKEAGEYCFYAMILFIIIRLVKVLPYGRFRQIHKVGAVLFLLAAFHSVYLLPDSLRWAPFGLVTQAFSVLGSLAALWSLFGQSGRMQRYPGQVYAIRRHEGNVLELEVTLPTDFNDEYLPGQFALLTFDQQEGSHPFTIVREDVQNGSIIFAIKALGDYTSQLAESIELGDPVTIEGPYGCFVLPESKSQEYWIAGGIGITPFMAWLEGLAQKPAVLISGSAVGWYGDGGERELTEACGPVQDDFPSQLCIAWEETAQRAQALGIRVVLVRTGLVLAAEGGFLSRLLLPACWRSTAVL